MLAAELRVEGLSVMGLPRGCWVWGAASGWVVSLVASL